jgi:hypothetical protein
VRWVVSFIFGCMGYEVGKMTGGVGTIRGVGTTAGIEVGGKDIISLETQKAG